MIVADSGTPFLETVRALEIGRKCFREVEVVGNEQSVIGWIEGPKSLVLRAIRYAAERNVPFLLLDSDAIPLKPHWLKAIESEYLTCGKKYMGHVFPCDQPGLPKLLMSPIAVYPPSATELIPLIEAGKHWDVSMTSAVLKSCHNTNLIQHLFGEMNNPPTFANQAVPGTNVFSPDWINPDAVIFHRNKDFTLINLLREQMGKQPEPKPHKNGSTPKAFFQMGRYGDLILLLPAFQEWARRTGQQTVVFTSKEFGSIFDGVSYVKAMKLPHNWHLQTGLAWQEAKKHYPHVIRTQLHGAGMEPVPPDDLPSFSLSMWQRTGLLEDYHRLPLVFDRRSPEREAHLIKQWRKTDKPLLLLNLNGATSPLAGRYDLIAFLCHKFGDKFEFINTNETNAYRLFDLLGLMDIAAGLITVDTSTLHLAAAAKCPYVALVREDGQSGSVPKGKIALKLGYNSFRNHLDELTAVVESWA